MAAKQLPDPDRPTTVSRLAAACALLAVIAILVPLARDVALYYYPREATLEFDLSPQACADVLMDAQAKADPCRIHAPYAVHPLSGELVLYVEEATISVPNWKRDLKAIDGQPADL